MKTWRLAAGNSHLYPGVRLRSLEPKGLPDHVRSGDPVLIEFADQHVAAGEILAAQTGFLCLLVHAHVTQQGTPIAARRWRVEWAGEATQADTLRVKGAVP